MPLRILTCMYLVTSLLIPSISARIGPRKWSCLLRLCYWMTADCKYRRCLWSFLRGGRSSLPNRGSKGRHKVTRLWLAVLQRQRSWRGRLQQDMKKCHVGEVYRYPSSMWAACFNQLYPMARGDGGGGVRAPRLVLSVKDLQGSWNKVKMNQGFIALSQSYKEREKDLLV